jgi:hypothetical protein
MHSPRVGGFRWKCSWISVKCYWVSVHFSRPPLGIRDSFSLMGIRYTICAHGGPRPYPGHFIDVKQTVAHKEARPKSGCNGADLALGFNSGVAAGVKRMSEEQVREPYR